MKKLLILVCLIFFATAGIGCKQVTAPEAEKRIQPLTLKYWTVFDAPSSFQEVIRDYQAINPHISVEVKQFRFDEFEKELLDALSEDRGPDIFSIHNTWMMGYKNKILSLPSSIVMPVQIVTGSLKKEVHTELQTKPALSLRQLRDRYVEQVYKDVVVTDRIDQNITEDHIYGLPLSFDSLALFYNRDLLSNAGIARPSASWVEFQEHVQKLTKVDADNKILLAGASLGSSRNIPRSTDILSLIMMQNGAQMIDEYGQAAFHLIPRGLAERDIAPGLEALLFYTDFAQPSKVVYTWNDKQPNALDEFIAGNVAFFFGYSYHIPTIRGRAPKLNFSVAPIPQIIGNPEVAFANYWIETVSKKSSYSNEAWDFLQFITKDEEAAKYLKTSKKPTAHLSLINTQLEDLDLGVFSQQALRAKSWYRGNNAPAMEEIFKNMIDQTILGFREPEDIINNGAGQVNQTLR